MAIEAELFDGESYELDKLEEDDDACAGGRERTIGYFLFVHQVHCLLEIQDDVWDNISRLSLYLYVSIFPFPSPLSLFVSLFMCFDLLYLSYIFVCTAEGPTCI